MDSALARTLQALRGPYASREMRLGAVRDDMDGGLLDTSLPARDASSPILRLAELFCRWATTRQRPPIAGSAEEEATSLPAHALSLVKLANKIGQPHVSKIVVACTRRMLEEHGELGLDQDWFDFEMHAAKAERILGEHAAALSTYRRLLAYPGTIDPLHVPKVLLNLGKMSHSYEWRTGLYLQLAKIAEARFRTLTDDTGVDPTELNRQIAICIDCCCQTELALGDADTQAAIFNRWEQAQSLCEDLANLSSYRRIRLRRTYAAFQRAGGPAARHALLDDFQVALQEIESLPDEDRGLAVRYGQLADMFAEVGDLDRAIEFLDSAIQHSIQVADWRALAGNAIRSSALRLRFKIDRQDFGEDNLSFALSQLRDSHLTPPIDVEVALLRQLAREHAAAGDASNARSRLDEVMVKLDAFERRILAESMGQLPATEAPSIVQILDSILAPDERAKVRDAGMVDYSILSRIERSVISELLDSISSDLRHLGSKQQVNISRIAVSTVLHDQKGRIDDLLGRLRKRYQQEFRDDTATCSRVLDQLAQAAEDVSANFNERLEAFAPRADQGRLLPRGEAVAISEAFRIALERGRFEARYPAISFMLPKDSRDFEIGIDADLLITVLDNLVQNAATASVASSATDRHVKVSWEWRENAEQFNAMALIHVEDSAGEVERLRRGLMHGATGRYGLKLARIFFDGLRGRITAGGIQGVRTVLTIELHASEIVRLL